MGGIALTMLNTAIPSLLKYLILTVSTYVASNLIVYFYRKVIKSKFSEVYMGNPRSVILSYREYCELIAKKEKVNDKRKLNLLKS